MSIIPNSWHESWNDFLNDENIQHLNQIKNEIGDNYYPLKENVLRFLQLNLNDIKCIIVGMDPYPSDYVFNGQTIPVATGRSFEVGNVTNWQEKFKQSSLRNILKTIYYNETKNIKSLEKIREEITTENFKIKEPKDWFNDMEKQGVMFLNASLTLVPHIPGSHSKIWLPFMIKLISYINSNTNAKWLLWGQNAQDLVYPLIDNEEKLICTMHPRLAGFVKENCFEKIPEINWTGYRKENNNG